MDVQKLELHHAMQLAILHQKMQQELYGEAETTLVMLEIGMKSFIAHDGIALGVFFEGLIVAFCLVANNKESLEVQALYVSSDYRRKGLGTALVDFMYQMTEADEVSFPEVELDSVGDLFYQSLE